MIDVEWLPHWLPVIRLCMSNIFSRHGSTPVSTVLQKSVRIFIITKRYVYILNKSKLQVESREDPKTITTTASATLKEIDHTMFSNITECLRLFSTLPVTTCECERNVSALRRLITYLRSMMSQTRLTGLALLHIPHNIDIDLDIDFDETIRRFARLHPRRMEMANILSDWIKKARKRHCRQLKLKTFSEEHAQVAPRSLRLRRSFCSKSVNIFPRSTPVQYFLLSISTPANRVLNSWRPGGDFRSNKNFRNGDKMVQKCPE